MFNGLSSFQDKVDIQGPDDCWEWQAYTDKDGYGTFTFKGKRHRAHRVAWELATGDDPGESHVLHNCDNPSCVNPAHLFLGTPVDNARDKVEKGRARGGRLLGERNGRAMLTEDDVRAIRTSSRTQDVLASAYGVSQAHISYIKNGKTWQHVT